MASKYEGVLKELNRRAELVQEQIGLVQRLGEIDSELGGTINLAAVTAAATAATAAPATASPKKKGRPAKAAATAPAPAASGKRKPGRPKGSKNKTTVAKAKPAKASNDGKAADLPSILTTIGQQVGKPLVLADFVTLVRESGYTTQAKDFSNMVYQSLLKLVKRNVFKKVKANDDEVARHYEFVKVA